MASKNEIKKFWDKRASEFGKSMSATLRETHLRKLEIKTMIRVMRRIKPSMILELGCGNGYATFKYAEKFPEMRILATDYSEKMIDLAQKNYQRENIAYKIWDITEPDELPFSTKNFDLIFSQRVIQNLPSWGEQKKVINNLINLLADNGLLILMECSKEGVNQLNKWRNIIGKKPIDGIIPWHNKFLEDSILNKEFSQNLVKIIYFSSTYMFITRLISQKLAKIAWLLPPIGKFGYDRIYVFKR